MHWPWGHLHSLLTVCPGFKCSITKWKWWAHVVASWHKISDICAMTVLYSFHTQPLSYHSVPKGYRMFPRESCNYRRKSSGVICVTEDRWELFGRLMLEAQQITPTRPVNSWISSTPQSVTYWEVYNLNHMGKSCCSKRKNNKEGFCVFCCEFMQNLELDTAFMQRLCLVMRPIFTSLYMCTATMGKWEATHCFGKCLR